MAVLNPIRNRAEDRYLEARVFLGLASSRAALLPVHVLASGGGYRVIVEAPLELDRTLAKDEAYVDLVRQYAARLEPHVLAYPGQWRGWLYHWIRVPRAKRPALANTGVVHKSVCLTAG